MISRPVYIFLFFLLGIVYVIGLFVPLMDNDAAHHANIALRMYQTGDYVNLIDSGADYLDKPHLHFWLCALSYHVFGVNGFAYKFPSFLFTILAVYSTYRLGRSLYDNETGKLSALIVASSFAFILSNNDVRMDAILVSCIAFSTWQLVDFIQSKKTANYLAAALGMALGFSAKGHIAVLLPAISGLLYILYLKKWELLYSWKWVLLIIVFGLLIIPELYCYYQQFNLHPEKIVRGRDHINGIRFVLLDQALNRYSGEMSPDDKSDYLFSIYTFLWAFAPWSILTFIGIILRIKDFASRKQEWLTTGTIIIALLLITFSGSKLPHYLNIVFPVAAVLTANYLNRSRYLSIPVTIIILGAAVIFNLWAFPVKSLFILCGLLLLLLVGYYFLFSKVFTSAQRNIIAPVWAMIVLFYLLNSNFYPQLLKWQGGNTLAKQIKGKIDPTKIYFLDNTYSSSLNFYTGQLRKPFTDSALMKNGACWIVYDRSLDTSLKYVPDTIISVPDYEITKLSIKFLNPSKRLSQCTAMRLARIGIISKGN